MLAVLICGLIVSVVLKQCNAASYSLRCSRTNIADYWYSSMSVESWDPQAEKDKTSILDEQVLARLIRACDQQVEDKFGLSDAEIEQYAALMQLPLASWHSPVENLEPVRLISLIKFFTLAEQHLKGWEAGARSPVIAIAKILRGQSAYPDDLTAWIRANSNNRFLPHGSLMDRL